MLNSTQKIAEVAIVLSDNIKKVTRDKEGHYILIDASVQQEEVAAVNV